jgi:uncharacterized protein
MPLIDTHVHLFPKALFQAIWKWFDEHAWKIQYKIPADQVAEHLKQYGIDRFFVLNYSHKAGMSSSLNQWTHEFCKNIPEAIPFGAFHPDDENLEKELDRCFNEYRFQGLKFHTHVAAIRPDDERLFPVYEKLIEHDRLITLHAGNGPSLHGYKEKTKDVSGALLIKNVLRRYPKLKLIMPHLGADEFDAFFELMEAFPNLWMDTTMAVGGYFPQLKVPWDKIEKFQDRILFGSDFPNIPYGYETEIKAIQAAGLSQAVQDKIFSKNAEKLLEIK